MSVKRVTIRASASGSVASSSTKKANRRQCSKMRLKKGNSSRDNTAQTVCVTKVNVKKSPQSPSSTTTVVNTNGKVGNANNKANIKKVTIHSSDNKTTASSPRAAAAAAAADSEAKSPKILVKKQPAEKKQRLANSTVATNKATPAVKPKAAAAAHVAKPKADTSKPKAAPKAVTAAPAAKAKGGTVPTKTSVAPTEGNTTDASSTASSAQQQPKPPSTKAKGGAVPTETSVAPAEANTTDASAAASSAPQQPKPPATKSIGGEVEDPRAFTSEELAAYKNALRCYCKANSVTNHVEKIAFHDLFELSPHPYTEIFPSKLKNHPVNQSTLRQIKESFFKEQNGEQQMEGADAQMQQQGGGDGGPANNTARKTLKQAVGGRKYAPVSTENSIGSMYTAKQRPSKKQVSWADVDSLGDAIREKHPTMAGGGGDSSADLFQYSKELVALDTNDLETVHI